MITALLLALAVQDPEPLDREVRRPTFPDASWQQLQPAAERVSDPSSGPATVFLSGAEDDWKRSPLAAPYLETRVLPQRWTLGAFLQELVAVRYTLAASTTFDEGNGPLLRSRLSTELERMVSDVRARMAESEPGGVVRLDRDDDLLSDRFQPESWPLTHDGQAFVSDSVFFSSRPTQVILALDQGTLEGLDAPVPFADYATLAQAIEFRAACARVVAMIGIVVQPALERTAARLGEIDAGWTNYLEHGFSQYPWESWANGWLTDFAWSRPPRSQWVLLHPELGLLFDTRSSRSAEMEAALLVHGLGYVRYFGDERDWFAGLSATASITGDASYGWGFGPTVHFGHTRLASRVPHVSVSLLWQDFEDGGNEPVLAATLDLWRLVDRGNELLYQSRLMR